MKVVNKTKNKVLHENIKDAKTFEEKTRGLLDSINGDAMMFDTRWGIHTFGMKFPIDCAICDDSNKLQVLKTNIPKRRFFFWNPKYKKVYEFPVGTLAKTGTEVGDEIVVEY